MITGPRNGRGWKEPLEIVWSNHCSHSRVPGIISNRPMTEKAYKDAFVHLQAKILPRFPLSKLSIYLFLYTDTQRYTKTPKQKKYKRRIPSMPEKAQEKKSDMLTNLQTFDEQLISNEDMICILQVGKGLKTKSVKLQSTSATRGNSLITSYWIDNLRRSINNPLLLTIRTAVGKSKKQFAENSCHNHWQMDLMCCVSHPWLLF